MCIRDRCEDVKQELAGSLFYSTVDGLKGFNLLENTNLAAQVLAVLSDLGCLLARVLQLGPCNGPFDFQYVVDDLFSLGPEHPNWFGKAWKNYLDDFAIRSGRNVGGEQLTDAEYEARLRSARPPPSKPTTLGQQLEACGYPSPDGQGINLALRDRQYRRSPRRRPRSAFLPLGSPQMLKFKMLKLEKLQLLRLQQLPRLRSVLVPVAHCGGPG